MSSLSDIINDYKLYKLYSMWWEVNAFGVLNLYYGSSNLIVDC